MSVSPVGTFATDPRLAAVAAWVSTAARLVLGGVFLVAGGLKVIDPQSSVAAVRAYRLLPSSLATIVGWGLPFAEIALGVLLLAGIATRLVAVASAVLLLVLHRSRHLRRCARPQH